MSEAEINASPTKSFFIDSLTRDLTLEDAILDLVDNSIDSAISVAKLDVSSTLLKQPPIKAMSRTPIRIEVSPARISVVDEAGGIDPDHARNNVFRQGSPLPRGSSTLGVFGVGLKRAVFKMGREITIRSSHNNGSFKVKITPEWLADESSWMLAMERLGNAAGTGTEVVVEKLRPEIKQRIEDPTLMTRLRDTVSRTYSLFLNGLVSVTLNGVEVEATEIPIGRSEEVESGKREVKIDGVDLELLAGLQPRGDSGWEMEKAGWYVICNGRVVVFADKSDLTGWGVVGPQFNPKHRGFVGVAFFFSKDPRLLPWTTTKRGLNRESSVFQVARREMEKVAKPVLSFLNNMYPSEAPEAEVEERQLAKTVKQTPLYELASVADRSFRSSARSVTTRPVTVSVQFKALQSDIEKAKKCLGKPRWSAGKVGAHALEYLLEQECPG